MTRAIRWAGYALVGVMWSALLMHAHAETFRGDEASCENLSSYAAHAAEVRDSGMPWSEFLPRIKVAIADSRDNPAAYVKDDEDEAYVLSVFKRVFDNPKMSPEEAFETTAVECMHKPKEAKGGGGKHKKA